jgi:membrane peptidoglycan carboxypeptidase
LRVDYPRSEHTGVRRYVPSWKQFLALVAVGFLAMVALVGVAYAKTTIPTPNQLAGAQTTVVYYSNGKTEIGRFGDQNRINVTIDKVPKDVQHAVLAAEDRTFYENSGVSPTGIARAFWNNLRGGSTQGGSTITQQYAKNVYLTQERTYKRKAKEFLIAVKLGQRDNKDKILQDYLNVIYFGRRAYGIETASETYFNKPSSDLTLAEGAVLAAIIRSPARYDPANHPEALQARFDYVLNGMVAKGWLSQADRDKQKLPEVAPAKKTNSASGTNYYLLDTVRRELKVNGFTDQEIDLGGLKVITTFQRKAQRSAVLAVQRERPKTQAKGVHIGLSAVRPGDGAVVAMYGGANAGGHNEATQARVQPGSAFKPFALTAALQDDISLKSRFAGNSPLKVPGSKPVNNEFNQSYGGPVDLIKATADSINTAYVDLTMQMGARKVLDAAVAAGIPEKTPGLFANARIPLGTNSARNIDMASAYSTFAAQGVASQWYTVTEVKGSNGGSRYKHKVKKARVFDEDVMADVTFALQQVVKSGTGTEAKNVGRPVAGKTGTAEDRSAWFVGFTPQLSAAVDFYKGDGTQSLDGVGGMSTFFGGAYPARVWTAFMKGALSGTEVMDFPPRADVGKVLNPKPTKTATPTPTTSSPTPTPTTSSPEPTPSIEPSTPTPSVTVTVGGGGPPGGGGGGGGSPAPPGG